MMKQQIIVSVVLYMLCLVLSVNVFAADKIFTNNNGVIFSKANYDKFIKIGFSEKEIEDMTQELYDAYQDMEDINFLGAEVRYFKETTTLRYGMSNVIVEEITQEEYETEKTTETMINLLDLSTSHETTYKKLEITSYSLGGVHNHRQVNVLLNWKKVPKIKSYDIIAARTVGGEIINNTYSGSFTSKETKFEDDCVVLPNTYNSYTTNYAPTYSGWNIADGSLEKKGVGLTAKLSSGGAATCQYDLGLIPSVPMGYSSVIHFKVPMGTTVYGSYQHASKSVDFSSVRKAYTFNDKGLGNVIYFSNNALANSYDGMGGVSLKV